LTIIPVDVTDFAALAPVLESIGACDPLVHAAGFIRTGPLGELSADDGAAMWRIHVDSAAFLANTFLTEMSAGGRAHSRPHLAERSSTPESLPQLEPSACRYCPSRRWEALPSS